MDGLKQAAALPVYHNLPKMKNKKLFCASFQLPIISYLYCIPEPRDNLLCCSTVAFDKITYYCSSVLQLNFRRCGNKNRTDFMQSRQIGGSRFRGRWNAAGYFHRIGNFVLFAETITWCSHGRRKERSQSKLVFENWTPLWYFCNKDLIRD